MKERIIENPLIGDRVTFIETARESNGKHTRLMVELSPKGGNDLHYHRTYSETFEVLEGELGVQIGKENKILRKGEMYKVDEYVLHRFFNPSATDPVKFNCTLMPGHEGFENTIRVGYGLCRDGKTNKQGIPKNFYHLSLLTEWSDSNFAGFLKFIKPFTAWGARKAVKKKLDLELLGKY